jgi:CMP-N,N'-diacetyllegionaminic acid synthase
VNRALNALCTICARGGSKGVKNKNIRPLCGLPLIAYSIRAARESGLFDHVVVSTDSDEIAEVAERFGGSCFFRRPPEMASDVAAKLPAIRHAFVSSEKHFQCEFDILVDLDATSPLRSSSDVRAAVDTLIDGHYDNVITACVSRHSPYFNLVEKNDSGRVQLSKPLEVPVLRRQDCPATYDMNASIYAWTRRCILTCESVIADNTGLYVMPKERSIDIDSEFDFAFVEFLLEKGVAGWGD